MHAHTKKEAGEEVTFSSLKSASSRADIKGTLWNRKMSDFEAGQEFLLPDSQEKGKKRARERSKEIIMTIGVWNLKVQL